MRIKPHLFLTSALDGICGQPHAQATLPLPLQGKGPTYPINRRLVGPNNQSGYFQEEIKSLASARIRTLDHPTRHYVVYAIPEPNDV